MKSNPVFRMVISALLIAVGIVIPLFMPKIVLPPASFTLASHVPIFIAMFISPATALAVAVGTAIGFFFSAPLIIALRAATHLVFAFLGAVYLEKRRTLLQSWAQTQWFSFVIALIHAAAEVAVVTAFYFGGQINAEFYQNGFVQSVLLLVVIGSIVHSMVDFGIALLVYKALNKQQQIHALLTK